MSHLRDRLRAQDTEIERLVERLQKSEDTAKLYLTTSLRISQERDGLKEQLAATKREAESLQSRLEDLSMMYRNCEQRSLQRKAQLCQTERDKAALRTKVEGLTRFKPSDYRHCEEHERGEYLDRSDVLALLDKPLQGEGSAAAVPREGEGEWRPGLPAEALRIAWPEWERKWNPDGIDRRAYRCRFEGDIYQAETGPVLQIYKVEVWDQMLFRPSGKTWAEVEALAATLASPPRPAQTAEPSPQAVPGEDAT